MAYPPTVSEIRAHVTTELGDPALQDAINDLVETIDDRYGPLAEDVVERFVPSRGDAFPLVLRRKPATITSIVEELDSVGNATRTLDPTDFRIRGYLVQRLRGGPAPAYGWSAYGVVVTYRPKDDAARRLMAIVECVKEGIAHTGFQSRTLGDYSETAGGGPAGTSLEGRRDEILRRRLAPKGGIVLA